MKKTILYLLILCIYVPDASAQLQQTAYLGIRSGNAQPGPTAELGSFTAYRFGDYAVRAGMQLRLPSRDLKSISGLSISAEREIRIRDLPLNAELFLLHSPYSELLSETNFGIIFGYVQKHLELNLGVHARLYSLNVSDLPDPEIYSDNRIWEYRNFIYRGSFFLNEQASEWNLSLTLSNRDHFLIQQETNPILSVALDYRLRDDLKLWSGFWYQGAGMLNLAANHYGYYFRIGIIWDIGV